MTFKTADLSDNNADKVQVVQPGLRNFGGKPRFHGEIVTIKAHGDFSQVRENVRSAGDARVLVIDNDGAMDCAMLGDMLATAAGASPEPSRFDRAGSGAATCASHAAARGGNKARE